MVRALADVPGAEIMSAVEAPNLEQLRAIEEPGVVFVSAGAGTGKTTVIVERFCRAVCARGVVARIHDGDVRHDPKGGFPCPTWCELWSMCRVRRS